MLNYLNRVAQPFPIPQSSKWTNVWLKDVPPLALEHDNLLNAILATSATNILRDEPDNTRLQAVRDQYVILAYNTQRKAVESLDNVSADVVCITALCILINAFAMLQERPHEPYSPPIAWLKMAHGSVSVIEFVINADKQAYRTNVMAILEHPGGWDESFLFGDEQRQAFQSLLIQNNS